VSAESSSPRSRAIYTLGNDAVFDWLVALCASIRRHDGHGVPIVLIPFDDRISRTRELQSRFGVRILEDERLTWLDDLGATLGKGRTAAHAMRKLVVFLEPADQFIFLDADAVLLSSTRELFSALSESDAQFCFLDEDLDEVYRPGPFRDALVARTGARGFNTGIFGGASGLFTADDIEGYVESAGPLRDELVSRLEQSFLNYMIDESGVRVASFRDLIPGLGGSWAGLRLRRRPDGSLRIADRRWTEAHPGCPETVKILHWAGYRLEPFMPYRSVYCDYRLDGATRATRAKFQMTSLWDAVRDPRSLGWIVRHAPRRMRSRINRLPKGR
jgi:hypothetical protein